jgi:Na+/H+ antiporter NhaC
MSSMASAADHVDHVRTQLPYSCAVALIAVLFGFIPAGFNMPVAASLLVGAATVTGVVMFVGKPEKSYFDPENP